MSSVPAMIMAYSEMPISSHDRPAYEIGRLQTHDVPISPTSPDGLTVRRIRNGSERSFAPTSQEQSSLDANESHNTLLPKTAEVEESKTAPPSKWRTFRQWAINMWFWEITLLFMSMAAFGAQVGILWSYSGSSLPDWPTGLTLNALISLLSAISASGLMSVISNIIGQNKWVWLSRDGGKLSHLELIDDASRGPWGSLVYLTTTRTLNSISLASIITICSLLTAPFVQQVVQIDYMTLTTNSTFTQDRVLYHNWVAGYSEDHGMPPDVLLSSMDQGMRFNRDLNDPLSRNYLELIPNCPTGNCSFDIHESLAICSECVDVSSLLQVHQNYTPANQTHFSNSSSIDQHNHTIWTLHNYTTEYASNLMNWTLPNGCYREAYVSLDPSAQGSNVVSYGTFGDCRPLMLKPNFPIVNITAILLAVDEQGFASFADAKAQECSMHWCVNRYKSQIVQGYLFEEVLNSSSSGRHITLSNVIDEFDNIYYELSAPGTTQSSSTNPEPSQWFNGTTDRFIVGRDLSAFLTHSAAEALFGNDMLQRLSRRSYDLQVDFSQDSLIARRSTPQGKQSSVESIFEAIALSMTTALRSQNQPDGVDWGLKTTPGRITIVAPVLRIRWVWLSLPASLQLGTIILLLHSRFSRNGRVIPIWKSSALAAVFFGSKVAPNLGDKRVTKTVEMNEIATRIRTPGFFP